MDVIKRLQNHHIKPSVQRIAIMNYLMEHRTHPTVDENIYGIVSLYTDIVQDNGIQYPEVA